MDKLIQLWNLAEELGVFTDFAPLQQRRSGVLGLYIPVWPGILLDESLRRHRREQAGVLATEIGHHMTVPRADFRRVYMRYRRYGECNESIILRQDERAADRWAADYLIPDSDLFQALAEGCRSYWDLAEWFNVPGWIVQAKLGFMWTCFPLHGLKVGSKELLKVQLRDTTALGGRSNSQTILRIARETSTLAHKMPGSASEMRRLTHPRRINACL